MPSISLSSCHSSSPVTAAAAAAAAAASAALKTVVVPTPPADYVSLFRSAVSSFSCRQKHCSFPPFSKAFRYDSAASTALRMLRLLVRPSTASYNSVINSFLLANRTAAAAAVFNSLLSSGLALNTASFTILLKLILSSPRTDRFNDAYTLLGTMLHNGHPPDAITYSTLIGALSQAGKLEEALGVLDLMVDANFQPTPQACTSLIHGYCSLGKVKEAKEFLGLIERYGLVPDSFMYTPLIDALSRIGDFEEVEKILGESQKKGWKPDEVTYNVYMNGLAKAGRIGEAFGVLDTMRFNGLLPSLETLSVLFDCMCREYPLRESIELLEWSSKLDWSPDVGFYNTLMSRHIENGGYVNVLPLYGGMVKKGIEPDSCTLTLIIRSMYASGKLQFAKCMLNADWHFTFDVVLFNTMLHMFYLLGENKEVINLFASMVQKNVAPNKFTYSIMIDSLCKEGRIDEAIDLVFCANTDMQHLIGRLLHWLARCRRLTEILKLLRRMCEHDYIMDSAVFSSLIVGCCKSGICQSQDFYKLSMIIDKILGIM